MIENSTALFFSLVVIILSLLAFSLCTWHRGHRRKRFSELSYKESSKSAASGIFENTAATANAASATTERPRSRVHRQSRNYATLQRSSYGRQRTGSKNYGGGELRGSLSIAAGRNRGASNAQQAQRKQSEGQWEAYGFVPNRNQLLGLPETPTVSAVGQAATTSTGVPLPRVPAPILSSSARSRGGSILSPQSKLTAAARSTPADRSGASSGSRHRAGSGVSSSGSSNRNRAGSWRSTSARTASSSGRRRKNSVELRHFAKQRELPQPLPHADVAVDALSVDVVTANQLPLPPPAANRNDPRQRTLPLPADPVVDSRKVTANYQAIPPGTQNLGVLPLSQKRQFNSYGAIPSGVQLPSSKLQPHRAERTTEGYGSIWDAQVQPPTRVTPSYSTLPDEAWRQEDTAPLGYGQLPKPR